MYKDFSLVLSGGGALGFGHLAVLEILESKNLKPKEIIGTSIGAIIGALVACNYSCNEIENLFKGHIEQKKGFPFNYPKWLRFSLFSGSLIDTVKIEKLFTDTFGNRKISELDANLKIIATDFNTGIKTEFSKVNDVRIVDALLASMAIPGIFPVRKINNSIYVDGSLSCNLAVTSATEKTIIASDAFGQTSFSNKKNNNQKKIFNFKDTIEKTIRIHIYNQTLSNMSYLKDDKELVYIELNTKKFKTPQFHKLDDIKKESLESIQDFTHLLKS